MKTRILFCTVLFLALSEQVFAQRPGIPRDRGAQILKPHPLEETGLELRNPLPPINVTVLAFLNNNTDGVFGFYLKRVNGPVLMAHRKSFAFYPASSIKVMEHLYAMRQVSRGDTTLNHQINIWGDDCSDDHSGETPQTREALSDSLRSMMKRSNNQRTNAIQDEFGRAAINRMAHGAVGMSQDSQLHHKFGCGGPASNPANRLTLADVGLLYEKVAQGTVLSGPSREIFYEMMRNETDSFFIESIVDSEADTLRVPAAKKNSFKAKVKLAYKSGSFVQAGFKYKSTAGVVSMPFAGSCFGEAVGNIEMRSYVYGVFINKARNIEDGTVGTAASELFRGPIREALKSWVNCPRSQIRR